MFRLNLYEEADAKRRARNARVRSTILSTSLIGVIVLLTAFHVVGGLLLRDRVRAAISALERREQEAAGLRAQPAGGATLQQLEARLSARSDRTLWSPKLAELARLIPASLVLDQFSYVEKGKSSSTRAALTLQGTVSSSRAGDPVRQVVTFVDQLQKSEIFSAGMQSIELLSVSTDEQSGLTVFRVLCTAEEAKGS
ncbi:MAG: PilN domain-containing protein [bacterium]